MTFHFRGFLHLCYLGVVVSWSCTTYHQCMHDECKALSYFASYWRIECWASECRAWRYGGGYSVCPGPCTAPAGTYCLSGSDAHTVCRAGSYCTGGTAIVACPAGQTSPAGSSSATACCNTGYECTPGSPYTCAAGYRDQTVYPGGDDIVDTGYKYVIEEQVGKFVISFGVQTAVFFIPSGSSASPSTVVTCSPTSGTVQILRYDCPSTIYSQCDWGSKTEFLLGTGNTASFTLPGGYGLIQFKTYPLYNYVYGSCTFKSTFKLPTGCELCTQTSFIESFQ